MNGFIDVEYYYEPGWEGTYYEPPEPEYIEVMKVLYKDIEVTDIVDTEKLSEILLEKIHSFNSYYDED